MVTIKSDCNLVDCTAPGTEWLIGHATDERNWTANLPYCLDPLRQLLVLHTERGVRHLKKAHFEAAAYRQAAEIKNQGSTRGLEFNTLFRAVRKEFARIL